MDSGECIMKNSDMHYEELEPLKCSATASPNLPTSREGEGKPKGREFSYTAVSLHTHNHNFKGTRASWHHHPPASPPQLTSLAHTPPSPGPALHFCLRIKATEPTLFWITRTNSAAITWDNHCSRSSFLLKTICSNCCFLSILGSWMRPLIASWGLVGSLLSGLVLFEKLTLSSWGYLEGDWV